VVINLLAGSVARELSKPLAAAATAADIGCSAGGRLTRLSWFRPKTKAGAVAQLIISLTAIVVGALLKADGKVSILKALAILGIAGAGWLGIALMVVYFERSVLGRRD
jgi:hypothetical protein